MSNDHFGPFLSFDLRSELSAQLPFKALGFFFVRGSLHAETTPYGKWMTKIGGAVCGTAGRYKIDRSDDGYGIHRSSLDRRML